MFNITELLKDEISVWERLKNCGKPVVLYGMGDGADKVLTAFDRYGIKASAVIASDDFVRGQKFHDFTVKKLSNVETEFGDIIIALCFASQLPDVMEHIMKISEKHETLVPSVPVFGNKLFDNDFITENKEQIASAYSLLADDLSKNVYENNLKFYSTGAIADKGVATKVATVDTILCGMAAGYIKADVEGADMETLIGMQKTMENYKPKLNFSAYHRFEDIFRLALYIHSVNPDYKIFLRHHPYIPAWDTNLYCI